MRIFRPLLAGVALTLLVPVASARAQDPAASARPAQDPQENDAPEGAIIRSVQVSGLPFDQLSPGLRQSIDALRGVPLSHDRLDELAARIQEEHPDVVTAVRSVVGSDGQVRVAFLVARISDDSSLAANINARYTIERVEIQGIPDTDVSQSLRDELQTLVGGRLDDKRIRPLQQRLRQELPGYEVVRNTRRGDTRGQIRLIFDIRQGEQIRWLHFAPSKSKIVYHEDQKWSGVLDIPIGDRDHRVMVNLTRGDNDTLIEEFSGFGVRLESRKVATERLGLSMEVSRYRPKWRATTVAALQADPSIPEAYRVRTSVTPLVTFAFSRHVRIGGGFSATGMEPLSGATPSPMASALVASLGYDQRWELPTNGHQDVEANLEVRSAGASLGSDLVYKRYFGTASYRFRRHDNEVLASIQGGRITGTAPLFERFTLGDSSTLRGWDKYAFAPVGGERMLHGSLEYRYNALSVFIDTGSVWDTNTTTTIRSSTGVGIHANNVFITLAFPLNADRLTTTFLMGVRF